MNANLCLMHGEITVPLLSEWSPTIHTHKPSRNYKPINSPAYIWNHLQFMESIAFSH